MKSAKSIININLLAMYLLFFSCSYGFSQTSVSDRFNAHSTYKNLIKTDIVAPSIEMFALFYERTINETLSAQSELRFASGGIIFTPELRVYLSTSNAPQGVYIAPWLRIGNSQLIDEDGVLLGGGFAVGIQTIRKRICVNIFVGPAFYKSNEFGTLTTARAGLLLGYAF